MAANGGRTECRIENKKFIIKNEGTSIFIQENGNNYLSIARFPILLANWIKDELRSMESKAGDGFVNKKRDGEIVVLISIRSNRTGQYASILLIPPSRNSGCTALCIPRGTRSEGWISFREAMEVILLKKKATQVMNQKDVCLEKVGGTSSLLVKKGYESIVSKLSSSAIIASFSNFSYSWHNLVGDLMCMFEFTKEPTISLIGGNSFLIKFSDSKDAELLMRCPKLIIDGSVIKFRRWRPSSGTLKPYHNPHRWIELIGLPVHLMNREVVGEICSDFGVVNRIETLMGIPNQHNCLQVLLGEADIFRVPQYVSVIDQGVPYTIKVSMAVNEIFKPGKKKLSPEAGVPPTLPKDPPITPIDPLTTNTQIPSPKNLPDNPTPDLSPAAMVSRESPAPHPSIHSPTPVPANSNTSYITQTSLLGLPSIYVPTSNLIPLSANQTPSISSPISSPITNQNPSKSIPVFDPVSPPNSCNPAPHSLILSHKPGSPLISFQPKTVSTNNPLDSETREVFPEGEDDFSQDSGDESDHRDYDIEPIPEDYQPTDITDFIAKKLVKINEILEDHSKKQKKNNGIHQDCETIVGNENSTPRVEQEEDRAATNKKTSEPLISKKVRKIGTRSARRRMRGALLLQSEEMNLEST